MKPADRGRSAVVLWTGGKDSALALHHAAASGYRICELVTFAPPRAEFRAHPLPIIRMQARALGIPHRTALIRRPYRVGYERALAAIQRRGAEAIVTGDIDRVSAAPNWIADRARPSGLDVVRPLWQRSRRGILLELLREEFRLLFSCVESSRMPSSWLGRALDRDSVRELIELSRHAGVDAAGEQGEYHTMVLDAPNFSRQLEIRSWAIERDRSWRYLRMRGVALVPKDRSTSVPRAARVGAGTAR